RNARPTLGLEARNAGAHVRLRFSLEVKAQLLVQFALDRLAPQDGAHAMQQLAKRSAEHGSLHLEHERNGGGQLLPRIHLGAELFAAGPRKLVELRVSVVVRWPPARFDPTAPLEPMQRRIERPSRDVEHGA